MKQMIQEVMSPNPITLPVEATLSQAAVNMRERDCGDVLVTENGGRLCGILTDRDIVVRGLAERRNPYTTRLGDVCTRSIVTVGPGDSVDRAVELMRDQAIRRLPVVDDGQIVGIVSLGDLARVRDPQSVLGQVSAAAPTK